MDGRYCRSVNTSPTPNDSLPGGPTKVRWQAAEKRRATRMDHVGAPVSDQRRLNVVSDAKQTRGRYAHGSIEGIFWRRRSTHAAKWVCLLIPARDLRSVHE
jgi:hypothetical protein